ncbi:hypothetical protein [Serratia symbiotica]|uniref:hypothetical protein n=1 Tax=Serratia symbiotica TaxID=138074 RepID=UPI001CF045A5|nr:hypothetical protein [Serratia symbiotica]
MATEYTDKDLLLMRQQRVQRIVDFIAQEYTADEINLAGEALWLAMQTICSPSGAAWIINYSQVK